MWGHTGEVPGYSSWDYTDSTGQRTASVIVTTIFGIATPKAAVATQTRINAAVCTMFGKPVPAKDDPALGLDSSGGQEI